MQKTVRLLNGKVCIIQTVLTLVQEHTVYLFIPNWSIFCKAKMWFFSGFFFLFFSPLSQCNLVGFSGAALHLHVDVQWGSCFLSWHLKPNIPPIDLYIPPPLCLKIFVYSSANVQAGHSNQKWQIWPVNSKMHLAEGNVWKYVAMNMKQPSLCLALKMCTQTLMKGGVFLILINRFRLGRWEAERENVFAQS